MVEWTECLERGGQINVITLILKKAFDKVPHQLLQQKLKYYNVNPTVINWIKSFFVLKRELN